MLTSWAQLLNKASDRLCKAGVPNAGYDAWRLLEDVLRVDRVTFLLERDTARELPEETAEKFFQAVSLREKRVPLQYIIGTQEFMGLSFLVNENVLIPRQDTETLVEEVLRDLKSGLYGPEPEVLDLCTGSGCIAVSLKKLMPSLRMTASDISAAALDTARKNSRLHDQDILFYQGDLFSAIPKQSQYSCIVSNPPYISRQERAALMPEVSEYEPESALFSDENGLYYYRRILCEAGSYLRPGGGLYFEIGSCQVEHVVTLMSKAGFVGIKVIQDLAGLDRVVKGYRAVYEGAS